MEMLKNEDTARLADDRYPFPGDDGPESYLRRDWDDVAGAMAEGVDLESRLACVKAARNPLLEASAPLLRALAEMPAELPEGHDVLRTLREMLAREINTFQSLCDKANLRREHVLTARYCLCTALDEAAAGMPWGREGGVWAHHSLAQRFHGDVHGGQKFFLLIGRLLNSPQEHLDLLEVMYRILGLGFQGMYINTPESRRELESIRHTLLTRLNSAREPVPAALSPRWQGESSGSPGLLRSVPVWVSASVLGLALFAFFAWHKYWLLDESMTAAEEIEALAHLPVPRQPLRLAELLKDEIAAGRVAVQDEAHQSSVIFRGDDMFMPARAVVSPKISPTLDRLAAELVKVPGKVLVNGHSDSQPIQTRDFPNNHVLSEKRAAAVADYLAARGVEPSRFEIFGKGADEPLADNATAAGRARNRRVEILVRQSNVQPRME